MAETGAQFILPASVAEPADLKRVQRELEAVDDFLRESAIRKSPAANQAPKTSTGLRELVETNGFNLLSAADRAKIDRLLDILQKAAPVMHISFAADPSEEFMSKVIAYLRQNVHPYMLVQFGLQPSIAAGCVVRTENKSFDFSLRQHLVKHRDLLIKSLSGLREEPGAPAPVPAAVQPQSPAAPPQNHAVPPTPPATTLAEPLGAKR